MGKHKSVRLRLCLREVPIDMGVDLQRRWLFGFSRGGPAVSSTRFKSGVHVAVVLDHIARLGQHDFWTRTRKHGYGSAPLKPKKAEVALGWPHRILRFVSAFFVGVRRCRNGSE